MTQLPTTFDSNQFEDMGVFEALPKGDYLSIIKESDLKTTKAGTGKFVQFVFSVIQGDYKGRTFKVNLNVVNPNSVAVEIAQKALATLCRACGKPVITDTQEIHNIPVIVSLKVTPASGDYPPGNDAVNFQPATLGSTIGADSKVEQATQDWADEEKTETKKIEDTEVPW